MAAAETASLELADEDVPVARVLLAVLEESHRRSSAGVSPRPEFRLSDFRARLARSRVFGDPGRLLGRLKRRGFALESPEGRSDRRVRLPFPEELRRALFAEIQRAEASEPAALAPVPDEGREIHRLDTEFVQALREIVHDRLEETLAFGREFSVETLARYLRELFGDLLYVDSLVALLQQYALADVPLVAPGGRATGSSGFHLSLFGPPGTGKTFSIDDLVRGDPKSGVPPHGLPGRNRYCGGITPVQFLRVGAHYEGRTFNFIVPEFNDWFKYRGMVEPLKLVMEQREVKWETTLGTVGPYTFRSFFSVNYNVRTTGAEDYATTIADPNFAALEDRMLLRFHPMTRERFRAVERSTERLELGDLDFHLAGPLRDHLTLVHAIESRHPLVARRFPARPVALDRGLYDGLREVSESALRASDRPAFSPRLRSRAVKLAAAAALVGYFQDDRARTPLPIGKSEGSLARRYYEEEIRARQGRRGS